MVAQPWDRYPMALSLRGLTLDEVCSCLASADSAARTALFSRFSSFPPCPASHASGPITASTFSAGLAVPAPSAGGAAFGGGGGGGVSVGVPSSLGDDILKRARETGCLTTGGVLELLRWCTPRVFSLQGVSPTVTDSLLLRYPTESCAMLEEVWLGWCPHLAEVEALLLKIRKPGIDGQEDEACSLRCLDVSGNDGLSDGILKALAGRCPALTTLKLDSCPAVTGAFLPRLAEGCPALSRLSADGCAGLTDAGVSTFIMESKATGSGALRSLRLGGCPVGSLTAQALLIRGSCLCELNLDCCSGFGDAAVRMLCRACPGLVELSLLGCPALTCRGAWQCTQHPSVETLSITLPLLPGPEPIIPPEAHKARRPVGGGGAGEAALGRRAGTRRDVNSDSRGKDMGGPSPAASLSSGGAAGGGGDQSRHTPSPPNSAPSSRSPPKTSRSPISPSGSQRRRRRGVRGQTPRRSSWSRSPMREKQAPECIPLPLPAVPPSGPLRRLKLELAAALPDVVAAAAETAAVAEATGGGEDHASGRPREPAGAAGFAFPLRRLAPLLPPGLLALDVWSSNAPPVPWWTQHQQPQDQRNAGSEEPSKATASGCEGGDGGAGGRRGYGRGGGNRSWAMSSAGDDGEDSPAFEGATGPKGGGREKQRSGSGAGGAGASGEGGGGGGGASKDGASGVLVLAAPGDLASLLQACPSLQELVVSGDPDQTANRVTSTVRGADAHKTTAAAGVHATTAAVAYFFRNRRKPKGTDTTPPPLRVLGVFDCPSLPPLAVLEAVAMEGGAGLENLAVGFSKPLPPPSPVAGIDSSNRGSGKVRRGREQERSTGGGAGDTVERREPGWDGGAAGGGGSRCRGGEWGEVFLGGLAIASETLRGLHVSGETSLTGVALRCPRLERIELVSCPLLEDVEVVGTPSLTEARFESCRIGDRALALLAQACWRLETLAVSGNASVGDPMVMSALTGCPRLKTLKASGCREIGASSSLLPFLLRHSTSCVFTAPLLAPPPPPPPSPLLRLEELTLSNAPGLTGAHLSALAGALPFLRRLSVSHCRSLVKVGAFSGWHGDGVTGVGSGGGHVGEVCDGVAALVVGETEGLEEACGEDEDKEEGEEGELEQEQEQEQEKEQRASGQRGDEAAAEGDGMTEDAEEGEGEGEEEDEEDEEDEEEVVVVRSDVDTGESVCQREITAASADGDGGEDDDEDDPDGCGDAIMTAPSSEGVTKRGRRGGAKGRRARNNSLGDDEEQKQGQDNEDGEGPVNRVGGRRRRKSSVGSAGDGEAGEAGGNGGGDVGGIADEKGAASDNKSRRRTRATAGGGKRGDKASREEARVATKKKAPNQEGGDGGGGGGEIPGGRGKGKRGGGGRRKGQDDALGDENLGGEGEDVCQGLEFKVDGKTQKKLERLAAALPKEPGRKRAGRPSCIRFLQSKCPRSAAECTWAHLPMHPPKTLKFKPLVTHAQEPSSAATSSAKRSVSRVAHPPPPPPLTSAAAASRWRSSRRPRPDNSRASAGSSGTGFKKGEGTWARPRPGSGAGGRGAGGDDSEDVGAGVCFESLQFLEICSCPSLKRLEGLQCPALAVARVTGCRELTSFKLEETPLLSHLDLTGCVRLEPWQLPAGDNTLAELRVVVLNYCRALQPKFLALLVDHARHLRRLEIYGAAVVAGPHSHGGGASKTKKEMSAGKRDVSRIEYNRLVTKAAAIIKGLDKGRPELKIVRTKKEFTKQQDVQ